MQQAAAQGMESARQAAAAAVEAAAAAGVSATDALQGALQTVREDAAAADSGGSWSLEPYWLLTLAQLGLRLRRLQEAQGVKGALAALAAADDAALAALPVIETLVAHGVYPCEATLGVWDAGAALAPVLGRWRHALTKWAARRPLLLCWLRGAPAREPQATGR